MLSPMKILLIIYQEVDDFIQKSKPALNTRCPNINIRLCFVNYSLLKSYKPCSMSSNNNQLKYIELCIRTRLPRRRSFNCLQSIQFKDDYVHSFFNIFILAAFKQTLSTFYNINRLVQNTREIDVNVILLQNCFNGISFKFILILKSKSEDEGVIVNISSVAYIQPYDGIVIYTATKFFVHGLTMTWGLPANYNRSKVRILGICPGVTITPMMKSVSNGAFSLVYRELLYLETAPPDVVGLSVINVIQKAPSGTMWIVEGEELTYKFELPDRNKVLYQKFFCSLLKHYGRPGIKKSLAYRKR
ncbi:alcohol dehydrogenase 1-like [Euwallacea similis]|uniref:alcohol dehydrogenase 1-like n=1 Tax=Euwallacea similis TaxID=1736056 RepID=UPI00344B264A